MALSMGMEMATARLGTMLALAVTVPIATFFGITDCLLYTSKTSLVPDEDQGVVFVNVSTAAGSSLKTTNDVMMLSLIHIYICRPFCS